MNPNATVKLVPPKGGGNLSHAGVEYRVGADGNVEVPAAIAHVFKAHGYHPKPAPVEAEEVEEPAPRPLRKPRPETDAKDAVQKTAEAEDAAIDAANLKK